MILVLNFNSKHFILFNRHGLHFFGLVFPLFEIHFDLFEHVDGLFYLFQRVRRCGNQLGASAHFSEQPDSHNGAEDIMVLTQIDHNISSFSDGAGDIDWVTGDRVLPMLNPSATSPSCSALATFHKFSLCCGCVCSISSLFKAPITMGMGSDLAKIWERILYFSESTIAFRKPQKHRYRPLIWRRWRNRYPRLPSTQNARWFLHRFLPWCRSHVHRQS